MKNRSVLSRLVFPLLLIVAVSELRGQANDNPTGPTGIFNGNSNIGCSVDPYTGNASRTVNDIVVTGAVGTYPLHWSRTLNTRTTAIFLTGFGRGGHWRHSYSWGLTPAKTVVYPDGRIIDLSKPTGDSNLTVAVSGGIGDRLQRFYNYETFEFNYNLLMADGGKVSFRPQDIDNGSGTIIVGYVAYAITDPHELVTSLTYEAGSGLLTQVTEPAGRWLKISYITVPGNGRQIETVRAGYGAGTVTQSITYTYTPYGPFTTVTKAAYNDGTEANYTYRSNNVNPNAPPLISTCDDVRYFGAMTKIAYEYVPNGPGVASGQLLREKHLDGTYVSTVTVTGANSRTETRGDGHARTFTCTGPYLSGWTDFNGKSMSQTRDTKGYINSFTDANGYTTNMEREPVTGRITKLTHPPDNNGTRYNVAYVYTDPVNPYYLDTVTDELGHTTTYQRGVRNRIEQIDYPDGGYETFTYNGFNQVRTHKVIQKTQPLTEGIDTFTYDTRGLKKTYYDSYHTAAKPNFWYQYDGRDRLWKVIDSRGAHEGDPNYTTIYNYNARGQLTKVTHPPDPVTAVSYFASNGYDDYGNRTSVTDELDHATIYEYDDYRRVTKITDPLTHFSTNSYLPWGKTSSYLTTSSFVYEATAPSGKKVYNYPDPNLRRTQVTQAPGTADQADTYFTYDNVGNLASVKDPRTYITSYGYDKRNRRTSSTDPYAKITRWEYDAAGNLKKAGLSA